jgi:uncharacterized lipoprotein YmbA
MNWKQFTILMLMGFVPQVLLTGCFGTSPTSRFYTLTPQDRPAAPFARASALEVSVGPVEIPRYLDRRQIVTRSGRNEIVLAEYDRWGGYLGDEITGLLVADLAKRLAPMGFAVLPWRSTPVAAINTNYRIPVRVSRFDGSPGGSVVLTASWSLIKQLDKKEETIIAMESTIIEEVTGKDYGALVAAMGTAVERLGKEMSDSLVAAVEAKKPK